MKATKILACLLRGHALDRVVVVKDGPKSAVTWVYQWYEMNAIKDFTKRFIRKCKYGI